MEEQVIVGEADMSRATQVRRQINKLIKLTNSSTFDIAVLLHEVKTKTYFSGWGFDSFPKYAETLEIKQAKAFYLVKIVTCMTAAGLAREQYEPIGLLKLRIISRLDPASEYKGTPVVMLIRDLTLKAQQMSTEEVKFEVDTILGLTAEESMCWLNICLKKSAREEVVLPALRKAKRFIGQTKDESGEFKDASDGAALEMICANFLTDPNYDMPEESDETESTVVAPGNPGVSEKGEVEITTSTEETDAMADEIADKIDELSID